MKKMIFSGMLCIGFLCLGFSMKAQGYSKIHDLSTGVVNGSTTLIAPGSMDDTWKVTTRVAYADTWVCSHLEDAWDIEGCGRWISRQIESVSPYYPKEDGPTGSYKYKTTFNISDISSPAQYKVFFDYIGADNNITAIKINGHSYPVSFPAMNDYNPLTANVSFTINNAHLVIGANEFIIEVNNSEGYTGFFACGYIGLAYL